MISIKKSNGKLVKKVENGEEAWTYLGEIYDIRNVNKKEFLSRINAGWSLGYNGNLFKKEKES